MVCGVTWPAYGTTWRVNELLEWTNDSRDDIALQFCASATHHVHYPRLMFVVVIDFGTEVGESNVSRCLLFGCDLES